MVAQLSFEGQMTPVARYRGAHLFSLERDMTSLEVQIASQLGVTASDLQKFEIFKGRCTRFGSYANERNCSLYVDAEQSFIQYGIESFGQQLTHKYNVGDRHLIMNGY
jgi:hypothetical protein